MDTWTRRYFSYILSSFTVYTILVYILKLPEFITNAPKLLNNYYYKNGVYAVLLDIFIIMIYISISMYVAKLFKIKGDNIPLQLVSLAITTFILTSLTMLYFVNFGSKNFFLTIWFKTVGLKASLYDVIIVCSIYLLMIFIMSILGMILEPQKS